MDKNIAKILDNLNYTLPQESIALFPKESRDKCKLLVYKNKKIIDDSFSSLPNYLDDTYTLILNDTKVVKCRFIWQSESDNKKEIFCLSPEHYSWEQALSTKKDITILCQTKKWKKGSLQFYDKKHNIELNTTIQSKDLDKVKVLFSWNSKEKTLEDIINIFGNVPIPPYLKREAIKKDDKDYQTLYAKQIGSVASPTSGLHYTPDTFMSLKQKNIQIHYLTLHISSDTFKPIQSNNIDKHVMHGEEVSFRKSFLISLLEKRKKIVASGTTSLRALESIYALGLKIIENSDNLDCIEQNDLEKNPMCKTPFYTSMEAVLNYLENKKIEHYSFYTQLMLKPPYRPKSCSALITNFHQPNSTLLLLIQTIVPNDWEKIYDHALDKGYKFLSYGDSSLLFI